jgi:hypothetical protein
MKWFRLICLAAMAGQYVGSAAAPDGATAKPEADGSTAKTPPVLRPLEPPENWQITLPTPAPAAPAV